MTSLVFAAVLAAAVSESFLHCLIKGVRDSYAMALLVAILGGIAALPVLAVTGPPTPAAWPWLCASVALGVTYWLVLGWAYQTGRLNVVYPMSRGTAVLMTAAAAGPVLGERLSGGQTATLIVVLLGLGLVTLSAVRRDLTMRALVPSLALALVTTAFMLVDASGARAAGSALAYCAVLYIGNSLGILALSLWNPQLRARLSGLGRSAMPAGMAAAGLSIGGYCLILFGMRHAPVGLVAAVAETSIVFVAFLSQLWLREQVRIAHGLGIACVAVGVAALRLMP